MADPTPLNRNQIARFIGNDPEAIRAIERLFLVAGQLTPADIDTLAQLIVDVGYSAGVADNKAEVATRLDRLSDVQAPFAGSGMVIIYNATKRRWVANTITSGSNITVTNADGAVTISVSGLGSMAFQNSNSVSITGGAIDGTVIGGSSAAAGTFTTVTASGVVYKNQPAQTSKAAAATLTIAELLTGIIQYTGALATLTLPTGTNIEGGVPATFPTNMSFDVSVINTGLGVVTLGTAAGLTLTGSMAVAAGSSGMFRVRKTATNTFTVYRIS
jgi:hypothetical protein